MILLRPVGKGPKFEVFAGMLHNRKYLKFGRIPTAAE